MQSKNPFDEMSIVTSGLNEIVAPDEKPKLVVETDGKPEVGWGAVPNKKFITYQEKPLEEWNMVDIKWYYRDLYFNRYGISVSLPPALFYQFVNQVIFTFEKLLKADVKLGTVKEYFDYYFERHADAEIKTNTRLSMYALAKEKPILNFIDFAGLRAKEKVKAKSVVVEVESVSPNLTIENLSTAYSISSKNVLLQYGVVIPVNFLLIHKKKSLDEAIRYVSIGLGKLSEVDKKAVMDITGHWGPYPVWLKFLAAEQFGAKVSTCTENPAFNCFKESK